MSSFLKVALCGLLFSVLASAENTTSGGAVKLLTGKSGLVDKNMNPAISVNGLFLGNFGNGFEADAKGIQVQEMEAIFTAAVDPYFLGNMVIANEGLDLPSFEVEEAWAQTLSIPSVTLKFGKFFTNFGKNNMIHTHAQPLIDRPLVNSILLGEHGINAIGMEAAYLAPTPWYLDLTVGALRSNGNEAFGAQNAESVVGTARVENLFDLDEATTLGVGGSFATGQNQVGGSANNSYYGADLTLKYVSPKGRGDFAVVWINEFISGKFDEGSKHLTLGVGGHEHEHEHEGEEEEGEEEAEALTDKAWGAYSTLLFRLEPRFWVGGRFDYVKQTGSFGDFTLKGENLILAYVPSEFSAIRLQGGLNQDSTGRNTWKAMLQFNMTIGSHPAHAY